MRNLYFIAENRFFLGKKEKKGTGKSEISPAIQCRWFFGIKLRRMRRKSKNVFLCAFFAKAISLKPCPQFD